MNDKQKIENPLSIQKIQDFCKDAIDLSNQYDTLCAIVEEADKEKYIPKLYRWGIADEAGGFDGGMVIAGSLELAEQKINTYFTPLYPEGFYMEVEEVESSYGSDGGAVLTGIYHSDDIY